MHSEIDTNSISKISQKLTKLNHNNTKTYNKYCKLFLCTSAKLRHKVC